MKKIISILILSLLITGCTERIIKDKGLPEAIKPAAVKVDTAPAVPSIEAPAGEEAEAPPPTDMPPPPPPPPEAAPDETSLTEPIPKAPERISLKPFGLFITPETSPVKGENFTGFHTGTDFEIFKDELNADVPVFAICTGTIREKKWVKGYGGVIIQDCRIKDENATVLYGHLKLSSAAHNTKDKIIAGEQIALLGGDKSRETDNARKHLHLGIHIGKNISYRGYAGSKSDLQGWLNYEKL